MIFKIFLKAARTPCFYVLNSVINYQQLLSQPLIISLIYGELLHVI